MTPIRHLEKRSLALRGRRTSVALERPFWRVLETAAREQGWSLSYLVGVVDTRRARGDVNDQPLASALRVWALENKVNVRP